METKKTKVLFNHDEKNLNISLIEDNNNLIQFSIGKDTIKFLENLDKEE